MNNRKWMNRNLRVEWIYFIYGLRYLVYRIRTGYVAINSPFYENLLNQGYKLVDLKVDDNVVICKLIQRSWKWWWQR